MKRLFYSLPLLGAAVFSVGFSSHSISAPVICGTQLNTGQIGAATLSLAKAGNTCNSDIEYNSNLSSSDNSEENVHSNSHYIVICVNNRT